MLDKEPLVRHAAVETFGVLARLIPQTSLNDIAETLHGDLIMSQAQV